MRGSGMTGEHLPLTNDHLDNDPKRRASRPDTNALIHGLERLRDCIEQRLSRLEALARERAAGAVPTPTPEYSELERSLQRQISEYQEAQVRVRAQADRHEQEWRSALEQLENDRRLLADAWERIERERIEAVAATTAQGPGRPSPAERTQAPARPRPRPRDEVADPANDSVTQAILQQFHALRNDVRRNSKQRGPI
jgi:DNA repair exonuclease SbcCD ATPase subunit